MNDTTSLPPGTVERRSRKGDVDRVTTARTVEAVCRQCGLDFPSTGTAWSHAASKRHTVDVHYDVDFTFTPREAS